MANSPLIHLHKLTHQGRYIKQTHLSCQSSSSLICIVWTFTHQVYNLIPKHHRGHVHQFIGNIGNLHMIHYWNETTKDTLQSQNSGDTPVSESSFKMDANRQTDRHPVSCCVYFTSYPPSFDRKKERLKKREI